MINPLIEILFDSITTISLRDNDWPTSLGSSNGKAHDTAVVLGWLEVFLGTIDSETLYIFFFYGWLYFSEVTPPYCIHDFLEASPPQECARDDLLQGLKVAVVSSNAFFRSMRACGLWVKEPHRAVVLAAAKSMCAPRYIMGNCLICFKR